MRLRAANQPAELRLARPTIALGRLRASGTVSRRTRGVVRVQIEYVVAGAIHTREFQARIRNGRWSLNESLTRDVLTAIAQRILESAQASVSRGGVLAGVGSITVGGVERTSHGVPGEGPAVRAIGDG